MRVCFFGLYDPQYPRSAVLRAGLRTAGVDVIDCRESLELGDTPSLLPLSRTRRLLQSFDRMAPPDVLFLPEFNQPLAALAARLTRKRSIPLVVDFAISLYDTAVRDRGQSRWRVRSQLLGLADRVALRVADRIITDSTAHARFFAELYGPSVLAKADTIYIGAPEWQFLRSPLPEREHHRPLRVIYFGGYIPLHGVEYIVQAAKLVEDDGRFQFRFIGQGQMRARAQAEVRRLECSNVEIDTYLPFDRLLAHLRDADICLGVFGTTAKAKRIIGNKVWQSLAVGRPVITGDGPAVREVLVDEEHCLFVPFGDPHAIAQALRRLADDEELARQLAANAADLLHGPLSNAALGRRFVEVLRNAIEAKSRRHG